MDVARFEKGNILYVRDMSLILGRCFSVGMAEINVEIVDI